MPSPSSCLGACWAAQSPGPRHSHTVDRSAVRLVAARRVRRWLWREYQQLEDGAFGWQDGRSYALERYCGGDTPEGECGNAIARRGLTSD